MEPSLLTVLQRSQLAALPHPDKLVALVRQLRVVALEAGARLFRAGDEADAAYLLTLGTLEIRAADGTLLDTEQPGALVGEQALMAGASGQRNATILAKTDCRLLEIDRGTFATLLDQGRTALEEVSAARTRNRLGRTAKPLEALLAESEQRSWDDGEFVFREGAASDGLYLVLSGQARVVLAQNGEPVHIATLYTGQCFGEIGVLQGTPRNAAIVAHNRLRAAFVPAAKVRELNAADNSTEAYLDSLIRSRTLPHLGVASQHAVIENGQVCTQTTFSLNDGRVLVALRTPSGHYSLSQSGSTVAETVKIEATTSVSLDTDGRIVGFEDSGDYEDVAGLQTLALDGSPLSLQQRRQLKKAAKAAAMRAPDKVMCRCLNVDRQTVTDAIEAGADSMASLQEATGCGTGCGGCIRRIAPILAGQEAELSVVRLGPPHKPETKGRFMGWLRTALDR
ncbi:cyclic nucleotide-binding domain-containing protein [Enhygromyxa salina]|uniref:DNA-binding transcriptional dual regulator Crp n=1 Tax=Enhygromyxa salina TaxID=215803 RepID=A0A2S9Y3G7_9BACT|nr:cyclic nucleotide-binding domain-containing protein [Enhygromyxa salina]PRP99644.1 DNA-binding transcriptional dual regulator Crp [Enhygromyxa salina]